MTVYFKSRGSWVQLSKIDHIPSFYIYVVRVASEQKPHDHLFQESERRVLSVLHGFIPKIQKVV